MRKSCKRKQRGAGLPTIFGMTQSMLNDLQIIPLGILESFREGNGTEQNWATLAAAINVAAVLARKQPKDVRDHIEAGMLALMSLYSRGNGIGKWVCTGDEYKDLRLALILGADMQSPQVSTRKEIAEAIKVTLKEAAHA